MNISRVWAMPNRYTFTIKPIRGLLERYVARRDYWFDPYAGFNSVAAFQWTNDLNPKAPTRSHTEALEFVRTLADGVFDGVLWDPPYSPKQAKECYESIGLSDWWRSQITGMELNRRFSQVKDEATKKLKMDGLAISCGWNTNGFGMSRGFEIVEVLLVPHGSYHNDTIVTVERKVGIGAKNE